MTRLVFAIGQFGGAEDGSAFPVRLGRKVWRLNRSRFAAWRLAHGLPDQIGRARWDRTAADSAVAAAGGDPSTLDSLLADGLVAAVDPGDPGDAVEFASAHRLGPLLTGVSERADGTYGLGLVDEAVMAVGGLQFALWAWSDVEPDLWAACRALADDAQAEPHAVLGDALEGLHGLLSTGAAYLDLAGWR
jgi:hypothetical protein